jgi:hypothetical protein
VGKLPRGARKIQKPTPGKRVKNKIKINHWIRVVKSQPLTRLNFDTI